MVRSLARTGILFLAVCLVHAQEPDYVWEPWGFGAGGKYQGVAVSSANPELLLAAGNMGGAFVSHDGGTNFDLIRPKGFTACLVNDSRPYCPWEFVPSNPDCFFAKLPGSRAMRTTDGGKTWANVEWIDRATKARIKDLRFQGICAVRGETDQLLAVCSRGKPNELVALLSEDNGSSWIEQGRVASEEKSVIHLFAVGAQAVIATRHAIFLSDDLGKTWAASESIQPVLDRARVIDLHGAGSGEQSRLYLSTSIETEEPEVGGVYVSEDMGRTWRLSLRDILSPEQKERFAKELGASAKTKGDWNTITARGYYPTPQFAWLSASDADPLQAYVCVRGHYVDSNVALVEEAGSNIYKTNDGGKTWAPTLFQNPRMKRYNLERRTWLDFQWGWAQRPTAVFVSDANPNQIMSSTGATVYYSRNAGKTWRQVAAKPLEDGMVARGQMQNTTAVGLFLDPTDEQRMYMTTADFGGIWRTEDRGENWLFSTASYRPGHGNNGYSVAFDPRVPGRMWATISFRHDIPISNVMQEQERNRGGVIQSDDYGKTWRAVGGKGFPKPPFVPLGVLAVPNGEQTALWVALCGRGIWYSPDGGETWQERNTGIDPENRNIGHIKRATNGVLYALSVLRHDAEKTVPGQVYASQDEGVTWHALRTGTDMFFSPFDLELDPANPDRLLVAGSARFIHRKPELSRTRGVWESRDAGKTWQRLLDADVAGIDVSPTDPNHLFASLSWSGLRESLNGGKTWRGAAYPFWRPTGVVFDPKDAQTVYVLSYGASIWRGTAAR